MNKRYIRVMKILYFRRALQSYHILFKLTSRRAFKEGATRVLKALKGKGCALKLSCTRANYRENLQNSRKIRGNRLEPDLFFTKQMALYWIIGCTIIKLIQGQIILLVFWNKAPSIGYKIKQVGLQSIVDKILWHLFKKL